jgi:hypothetical protein
MNIKHELISFHAPTGSMLVRYFSDEVPDGLAYNIDIPLENGSFVGQEKIDELIEAMKPIGQLERIAALQSVVIPETLAALIPPETVIVDVNEEQPIIEGTDVPPIE